MRRVSIMLEVNDEVYDTLVEPMKKNKAFSKLLASLMEGYLNDGYIRAYADDTLEDMRKATVSSFNKSIDSMSESLSKMGLFTDEIESVSLHGKKTFQEKANQQKEELFDDHKDSVVSVDNTTNNSAEFANINKRIDDMQASFNTILSQLLEVVKNTSNPTVQYVPVQQLPVQQVVNPTQSIVTPVQQMVNSAENQGANESISDIESVHANTDKTNNTINDSIDTHDVVKKRKSVSSDEDIIERKTPSPSKGIVEESISYNGTNDIDTFDEDDGDSEFEDANNFMMSMLEGNSFEF